MQVGIRATVDVLVPTRVEAQVGRHRITLRVAGILIAAIRALAVVAQHEDGVLIIINTVVLTGSTGIVVRSRVAVQQMAPHRHVGMGADNLGHVRIALNHAVHLVDVAVLTGNVAFHHLLAVHPGLLRAGGHLVGQHRQVGIGNLVVGHVGGQEVNHRRRRGILQQGNRLATLTVSSPSRRVRHQFGLHHIHRVIDTRSRLTAHCPTLLGSGGIALCTTVRHQLDEVRIVDHRVVQQQLLLGAGQLVVVAHTPGVLSEPNFISTVGSGKQRLRTGVAQHLVLAHVVDELQRVLEVAFFRQTLVDGVAEPVGLPRQQVVILTRLQGPGTHQQAAGDKRHLTSLSYDLSLFHNKLLFYCY